MSENTFAVIVHSCLCFRAFLHTGSSFGFTAALVSCKSPTRQWDKFLVARRSLRGHERYLAKPGVLLEKCGSHNDGPFFLISFLPE